MSNLLQSSQNKSTCAPAYYTSYLQNLASKGQAAQCAAKYVGAQPLQEEAFCKAATNFGQQAGTYCQAESLLGCAANQNILGAAAPYLNKASDTCTAQLAQSYMSPYIQSAAQGMSNIAQRNIQQNLAPAATAATVGSGQFGSQRGAQVLGQVEANAEQCLNSQIANMENTGYQNALNAATQKQQICAGIGQTAGTLTAEQAKALTSAGSGLGTLGTQAATQNLACINALATLGAQCQTIQQNAQCYPFTTLSKLSSLLSGAQIPTSVKTTMCMSPLSAVGAVGSLAKGIACSKVGCGISSMWKSLTTPSTKKAEGCTPCCSKGCGTQEASNCTPSGCTSCCSTGCGTQFAARGGLISRPRVFGCASLKGRGGLPGGK